MGNHNRDKREVDTRERVKRKQAWTRPDVLFTPPDEDGYTFRYVRLSMRGENDPKNISSKLREGWEPVKASDYPEAYSDMDVNPRFNDNVVIGGLVLCKAPIEMVEERKAYYEEMADGQMESVDQNLMRESDARMPVFNDRRSTVTFGKGK